MKAGLLLVSLVACRPSEHPGRASEGNVVAAVPEHPEMSTLPPTALPPIAMQIGGGNFASPETVIHDLDQDVYLVSNINGNPNAADHNGYISKLSPMGAVLDKYFIDGRAPGVTLDAPRGMALGGNTLYVADAGGIRLFDRRTGKQTGNWELPEARFLNGLAIDASGQLLATDTGIEILPTGPVKTGPYTIYRFDAEGHASAFAQGDQLEGPNGIVAGPDGILVIEFMGDEHGVYALDDQGSKKLLGKLPYGELDGLVALSDGSLLVSSWLAAGIYRFVPGEPPKLIMQHLTTPAGIGYDVVRNRILIPELMANAVRIEEWAPPSSKMKPMAEHSTP